MEQIAIKRPNGSEFLLEKLYPVTVVTKAQQQVDLLGQDVLNVEFEASERTEMQVGMTILAFGSTYTLNQLPSEEKLSTKEFRYKCTFEGPQYDLLRSRYFNVDASGFYTGGEFSLTGKLEIFVDVLIRNLTRTYGAGSWVKGNVLDKDIKTLTFSSANCLEALQQNICKEFEVEFSIYQIDSSTHQLNVSKAGEIYDGVYYEYGQGKGLYSLSRKSVKESSIITRLYPYGSSDNLKADYRGYSTRLKIGNIGSDYLEDEDAIDAFGLIEAEKVFEEIKPHREGTVTGLVDGDFNSFIDATMDFDLNEKDGENTLYLVAGKSAKVHFNTGNLAGYEFEIIEKSGYDNSTKKFTLIPFTDERGLTFPNPDSTAFQMSVGDTYVLLDIVMPDIYIINAEAELRTKAQNYLDANKKPLVSYELDLDPMYLKGMTTGSAIPNFFTVGDYIRIRDEDLNIDQSSRVVSFTRDLQDPFDYTLQIADSYQTVTISRIISDIKQINNIIELNDLRNPVVARQNWKTAQEALNEAFDPDGFLKDGKIRAESLQAAIALFGTEGQQFQIINMVFMPNYEGQKNVVRYTSGTLVHLTIEPDTIRNWSFGAQTVSLGNDAFKYVYAKCSRTTNGATMLFSEDQIKTKQDPLFYHFLVGSLSTVDSTTQTRALSLSYGFTLISGRHITTGIIQSSDGSTYFDLDKSEMGGNIKFRSTDGITKPISQLETDLKALIEGIGEQVDGQIESWFYDGTPTLANTPAINWNTQELKELHLGDLYYDQISGKSYRFRKNDTVYSWTEVTDDRVTQALVLASKAQDTADGKRRIFVAQPIPPYDKGDMWNSNTGLKICQSQRLTGNYNPLDWDLAEVYDNTVTAINGGMAVTGALYLANEDGTIKAGIRGGGQGDNVILLFLGASAENAEFAPMRARRGGILELRSRLELFNSSNVGVAGICGINSPSDGTVLAWFGSPYAGRASAPTRMEIGGKFITQSAKIGEWDIDGSGLTNLNGNGYIIARSNNASNRTEIMLGANIFPATFGGKGSAVFRAEEINSIGDNFGLVVSAKNAGSGFRNYATYAPDGITFSTEGLTNGLATYKETITVSISRLIDISKYEYVSIFPNASGIVGLAFTSTQALPIKDGKKVIILNTNNSQSLYLYGIIRGATSGYNLAGGAAITIMYDGGFWYGLGTHDNNW